VTAPAEEDEFTELVDADFPRVDLVGKGANGIPRFLIAKQDGRAGLLDPEFVRSLIAKESGPAPADTQETVTMTGSPAAIAKLIHGAPVRQEGDGEPDDVAKADMSTASINDLPDSAFAYIEPGGKKDEHGRTTPRSLRHFPIHDAAHVRNALSRAPQSPFGDRAMGKIRAAAKKFGIGEAKKEADMADQVAKADGPELDDQDGTDPALPLAAPDDADDLPGDPADPGSPAWEGIDAASAMKWTAILARARAAICLLAEREAVEASMADPADACHAAELQSACDAIDYAISVLAPFAVAERSEADMGAMEIAKAMAGFDPEPLSVVEALASVRKAGRVLSAANESKIRDAAAALNAVLSSLPAAPVAEVAKQKEPVMPGTAPQAAGPVVKADNQGGDAGPAVAEGDDSMGGQIAPGKKKRKKKGKKMSEVAKAADPGRPVPVYGADGAPLGFAPAGKIRTRVAKADGDADGAKPGMQAVFDQDGDLVGVCDPADITPVSGTGAKKDDDDDGDDGEAPAPDAGDLTPQPAAEAGTPAATVAKGDGAATENVTPATMADVLKTVAGEAATRAVEALSAAHQEVVAKMAADKDALAAELQVLKGRLETVENTPAAPKAFASGATPPKDALRGQDQGGPVTVDVAKARARKEEFYRADPVAQNRLFLEMQQEANALLEQIHGRA
jgi:hypothetical protein